MGSGVDLGADEVNIEIVKIRLSLVESSAKKLGSHYEMLIRHRAAKKHQGGHSMGLQDPMLWRFHAKMYVYYCRALRSDRERFLALFSQEG